MVVVVVGRQWGPIFRNWPTMAQFWVLSGTAGSSGWGRWWDFGDTVVVAVGWCVCKCKAGICRLKTQNQADAAWFWICHLKGRWYIVKGGISQSKWWQSCTLCSLTWCTHPFPTSLFPPYSHHTLTSLLLTLLLLTPASHTVTVTAAHMHGGPHDATAASHTAIVVAGCVHAILQLLMLLLLLLFLLCIRAPSR